MFTKFEIDKTILDDYSKFYEQFYELPPLAAKVISLLQFDFDKAGVTFDELKDYFSASKSSVSNAVNLLLSKNLIIDFKLALRRKRYFTINPDYPKIKLGEIVEKLETEISLLERIQNTIKVTQDKDYQDFIIYKNLLQNNINDIKVSLRKLDK